MRQRRPSSETAQPQSEERCLWAKSRSGARAGRGFRFQDAVTAALLARAWRGDVPWTSIVPEGLDDVTLHGDGYECRAQIKSRRDPQARFSISEVADFLVESTRYLPGDWRASPTLHLALVLERPVDEVAATGWGATFDAHPDAEALVTALAAKLDAKDAAAARDLVSRLHLIIEAEPLKHGVGALTGEEGPRAQDRLAMHALRECAGRAADANGAADMQDRAELGRSDVQRILDEVQGVVDPAAYLELTGGLCEVADFDQLVSEDAFRDGVNVLPGHVGAGLVFAREEPCEQLGDALNVHRFGLVAGPSGAGKSAVAWLVAHGTRHAVRWYRVRRLPVEDVGRLVQLAKVLAATPERPVGFVVDDVGRPETEGWDSFVREIPAQSGVMAIGTVREEDLLLLGTATRSVVVRPVLDEGLAERIWSNLYAADKSAFGYWREPFERSQGLLLEFIHLLSQGQRLEETLTEQVRRRLVENRGDELVLLRTIAFAAALGGTVDSARLRAQVGYDEPRFAKALHRLIDEHAVRIRDDGAIAGLHEIRSAYLDTAVREILGTPRAQVLASAIDAATADTIAALVLRLLRQWPEDEADLIAACANRLPGAGVRLWIGTFHGLGLATVDRVAAKWLEVSRGAEIDDRHSGMVLMMALSTTEFSDDPLFAKVRAARNAYKSVEVTDLRTRLAEAILDGTPPPEADLEEAHLLAAALVPIWGCAGPSTKSIGFIGSLEGAELIPLLELLRTLHEVDPEMAQDAVDRAGGSEALIERIHHETAWVTRPELGQDGDLVTVTGHVKFIHPEVQDDLNAEVVRLCELMAAAAPRAQLICSQARYPDGSLAKVGDFTLAEKRMPRANLTTPVRVAWNRSQLRALNRLVAAPDQTGRDMALAGAINELADKVVEAGDFYCRMKQPGPRWRLFVTLRTVLTDVIQPARFEDAVRDPLDRGSGTENDDLHGFVTGLQRLLTELTDETPPETLPMSGRTTWLVRSAAELQAPGRWRMTSRPPLEALGRIEQSLLDVRAVLGDVAKNPDRRAKMAARYGTTSQRHNTLHRAAADSRRRAQDVLAARRTEIGQAFAAEGLDVVVASKPAAKDDGWDWPSVDIAVLMRVERLADFYTAEPSVRQALGRLAAPPALEFAPVIAGKVAPLSYNFLLEKLGPGTGLRPDWDDHLPFPRLEDLDHQLFGEALDAVFTLSGILLSKDREFNLDEDAFVSTLVARFTDRTDQMVARLGDPPDELLAEVVVLLARLAERVREEASGAPDEQSIAAAVVALIHGHANEVGQLILGARLVLLERAVQPNVSALERGT